MEMKIRVLFILAVSLLLTFCTNGRNDDQSFSFVLTADMREYTGDNINNFRGACEAISKFDNVQFMISPGDLDPPDSVLYTINKYIGPDMPWYPVVGNHEAETTSDMEWLRNYNPDGNSLPNIVNLGPASCLETTYSFDYKNTHFVILNEYCTDLGDTCSDGDIRDTLYDWLKEDLTTTEKENIIVVGHEPAYPLPDMESQRFRHKDDSLNKYPDNRDRFVSLLQEHHVRAYMVGHTHNYSIAKINDLWHVDVGHARGIADMGARSTFIKINIKGDSIDFETYRLNYDNDSYELADRGNLH